MPMFFGNTNRANLTNVDVGFPSGGFIAPSFCCPKGDFRCPTAMGQRKLCREKQKCGLRKLLLRPYKRERPKGFDLIMRLGLVQ